MKGNVFSVQNWCNRENQQTITTYWKMCKIQCKTIANCYILISSLWVAAFPNVAAGTHFISRILKTSAGSQHICLPSGVIILNNIHHHSKADQDHTNNKISMCFCATLSSVGFHLVGSVVFFTLRGIELQRRCFQIESCAGSPGGGYVNRIQPSETLVIFERCNIKQTTNLITMITLSRPE